MKITPAQHLVIVESLIRHRPAIVEYEFDDLLVEEGEGLYEARLHFYDDSYLQAREHFFVSQDQELIVASYSYQFCSSMGDPVLRFDNAPHYPQLPGFPHHAHERGRVRPSEPMTLKGVLDRIEGYLSSSTS